jgi:hypothetical protein
MGDDETIIGHTEITLADQMRAIFWSKPRLFCVGGAVVVAALLVNGAVAAYGEGMDGITIIVSLGCIFFWPALVTLSFRRLSSEQRLVTYEINADQITTRDATGAAIIIPWRVVRRVAERRSGFAINVMPTGTRWIPKRAFAANQIPLFHELIERKLRERMAPVDGVAG